MTRKSAATKNGATKGDAATAGPRENNATEVSATKVAEAGNGATATPTAIETRQAVQVSVLANETVAAKATAALQRG